MSNVNKVILVGRVGRDPEVRYTQSGQAVASFSLATSKRWTDKGGQKQEKTEWHRCVAWAKTGELCGEYLSKGSLAYVEGELETRQYKDKGGVDRYVTEIKVLSVQFLTPKSERQEPRPQADDLGYGQPSEPGHDTDDLPF